MGTNYYLHRPRTNECEHCGRADEAPPLHIGKSSSGWCFSLHVRRADDPEHVLERELCAE